MRQTKKHMPRHAIVCRGEWLRSSPQFWSKQDWNPALVCPVVGRKPCKMWCELHAFHHFASNVHALFLVISWFIQKNFLPRQSAKLHVGIPESLLWKPFDILEYILIPVIVLNMKWSYVKKNIHISWKWAPTGFDEAPPTIYQRDWHKWYKIHDTLRIGRFQNWWFSRSQKNPP